ncbi:MAG: circadian clock protein KaiC [Pseudomonadota bacterium]
MAELDKLPTGIRGLDHALNGGVARGRATLLTGGPGCGKTLLALSSAVHTVVAGGHKALFVAFEEARDDLLASARAIGLPIDEALDSGLILNGAAATDAIVGEVGEYSLEALTLRLGHQIEQHGIELVALDTLEALFSMFSKRDVVRKALVELLSALKSRDVAVVITAEEDGPLLGSVGLEQYVADCVVLLDQQVVASVVTRRLRIRKYRGSAHATGEMPFLIDSEGVHVMPVESAMLDHQPLSELQETGAELLDEALGGGLRRGSTALISGATGVGKTQLAARIAVENCAAGRKSLIVSFEESPAELLLNLGELGERLSQACNDDRCHVFAARPTQFGLERHLVAIYRLLDEFQPDLIVVDPISSLEASGPDHQVHRMLVRLMDGAKRRNVTGLYTTQMSHLDRRNPDVPLSSIIDHWLHIARRKKGRRPPFALTVIKARGLDHWHDPVGMQLDAAGPGFRRLDDER